MTNWAAITAQVIDNGYGESRRGSPINGAIPHHAAGSDALAYVAGYNDRNSHPTYHIDRWGKVTGIVHPDRRPYSTANAVDQQAITFEMDNVEIGGDWRISDATRESLIEVLLDHERQSAREGFAVNQRGVDQDEFFIGWHSQYVQTACPGPYVTRNIPSIVDELNRRRNGDSAPVKKRSYPMFGLVPDAQSDAIYVQSLVTGKRAMIRSMYDFSLLQRVRDNNGGDDMLTSELDIVEGYISAIGPGGADRSAEILSAIGKLNVQPGELAAAIQAAVGELEIEVSATVSDADADRIAGVTLDKLAARAAS